MTEPENQPITTPESEPVVTPEAEASVEQTVDVSSPTEDVASAVVPEAATEEPVTAAVETSQTTDENIPDTTGAAIKWQYYVGAAAIVAVIVTGVLYVMDTQGRIDIPLFSGVQNFVAKQTAVASVNGSDISEYDYNVSVAQITAGAEAQGVDLSDPELQSQITAQAMDMLVNTELLKQEAARRGIEVTDEQVQNRLTELETEVGGAEVLQERMRQFNIDDKTLRRDIHNELTIQALLDQVFAETAIEVTEEEIQSLYAGAGGAEAGLPPLEEVREQVVAQIRGGKEQEVVTTFLQTLKETATIEILI